MKPTDQEQNEALALLLGYERDTPIDRVWRYPSGRESAHVPDFLNDWTRFPELQAYVRGLDLGEQQKIGMALADELIPMWGSGMDTLFDVMLGIDGRILGEAILEVCGEAS